MLPPVENSSRLTFNNMTSPQLKRAQHHVHLLDYFILPSLLELEIWLCFTPYLNEVKKESLSNFNNLFNRSQCQFSELVVREKNLRQVDALPFLGLQALQKVPEVDFASVDLTSQGFWQSVRMVN